MKTQKLKKILNILSPDGTQIDFKSFDDEVAKLKSALKEKIQVKTLDDVSTQLEIFKKKIDFSPLLEKMGIIEAGFDTKINELSDLLDEKTLEIKNSMTVDDDSQQIEDIVGIKNELEVLRNKKEDLTPILEDIKALKQSRTKIYNSIADFEKKFEEDGKEDIKTSGQIKELQGELNELRTDLFSRISRIGGGNMNRQIKIGGVDYLTKYTDINFIAGFNTTITVTNDDTNKRVNVTFAASGIGLSTEIPSGAVDDSNTSFTVVNQPKLLNINGAVYTVGTGTYSTYLAGTITLSAPVGVGGFIINIY